MKTIAIYPGRFQPFGKHHAATFMWVQNKFGAPNSFIATSDIVDPFQRKQLSQHMGMEIEWLM
jgi:hypothetical protein